MYKIDFSKPIHIHFIGIGGISMSGLAEILHEEGFTISGSDSKESDLTKTLAAKGIKVIYGQSADNITSGIDLVVYTAAIHEAILSLPQQRQPVFQCLQEPSFSDRLWTITIILSL